MSALAAIVAEAEAIVAEVDASVAWGQGRLALSEQAHPPRVVAVPTDGTIEMTDSPGRVDVAGVATRELYQRRLGVDWYCWGASLSDAETLAANVLVALRRGDTHGSIEPEGERWLTQEEGESAWAQLGECVVLRVAHLIPVVDRVSPLATVTATTHESEWTPLDGGAAETGICS
jgi:hypothetical protein